MYNYKYSKDLANLVKQFLVEDDWHFFFDENIGMFDFVLRVKSKIQRINYIVDVHENEMIVYGVCPIGADHTDANMMGQMAEFICRANHGIKNGCFEFDFNNGEIRFKSFIDCDGVMPSSAVIKNSIHCTAVLFKRYASGILDIIFSGCTAKEAIDKCAKAEEAALRSMFEAVDEGTTEDVEVIAMMKRLAAELGITEDDGEESEEELDDDSTDEIRINPFASQMKGGVD